MRRMLTTLHLTPPAARDASYRDWALTLPGKQVCCFCINNSYGKLWHVVHHVQHQCAAEYCVDMCQWLCKCAF